MKILSIVGARPQFVKAFPVSNALRPDHEEILVHTGQHYDAELSDVFFSELPIPEPDYNLGIGSGTHAEQTGTATMAIDETIRDHDPDAVIVYGDTNSTLAGALAAAKRDPVLVHVESGLRSGDRSMPEETNRVLTDHAADLRCTPSRRADETLATEGITDGVARTGDVMYDALLTVQERALAESTVLDRVGYADGEYVLATVHRAANTDDPARLEAVATALGAAPLPVVFPAHPRTVNALKREGLYADLAAAVDLVDPVGYLDFVRLLDGAERVATDSGGVQKEAFYLETPCVTLRDRTEWVETVDAGWNVLVGADPAAISEALEQDFDTDSKADPYGDGNAAAAIRSAVEAYC